MAIKLRSRREIDLMRRAGAVVAGVLSKLQEIAEPGVTTAHLDEVASQMTAAAGAETLFKGVRSPQARQPFPGAICASINEEVVHGIPSKRAVLREGDVLSVDFGVRLNGYCGDAAVTIPVGRISEDRRRLLDTTRRVLGIEAVGLQGDAVKARVDAVVPLLHFGALLDTVSNLEVAYAPPFASSMDIINNVERKLDDLRRAEEQKVKVIDIGPEDLV